VSNEPDVLVVGAGVSGLTTAVCLAEAGFKVKIQARGTGESTTSFAAGATWSPYLIESSERARDWSFDTLDALRELAGRPGTGVVLRHGVEAARQPPPWHDRLAGFELLAPHEVPGGLAAGWRLIAPVVDMPVYLGYLRGRAEAAGVRIERRELASLDDADAPTVVNCTGIGARELAGDAGLIPVRGQVVVVANPGVTEFLVVDGAQVTYFFPHGDTAILGGTAQRGDDNTEPDPGTARDIVARCARLEPLFAGARVLGHRVGLRPTRPTVRLEREGRVIHNYGHGGAGVTVSWGCAHQVTTMLALGAEPAAIPGRDSPS
jgi:D-amino-acid oxidase